MTSIANIASSVAKALKNHEIADQLSELTHFTSEEIKPLLKLHDAMTGNGKMNLDRMRFRQFLMDVFDISDGSMLDLMCRAFDLSGAGHIEQEEFVVGLSIMLRGDIDEISDFCYRVYDLNGNGSLDRGELEQLLRGSFSVGGIGGLDADEVYEAEAFIIDTVFKKFADTKSAQGDSSITDKTFQKAVREEPLLINACGGCLPNSKWMSTFLYFNTTDFRAHASPLLGTRTPTAGLGFGTQTRKSLVVAKEKRSAAFSRLSSIPLQRKSVYAVKTKMPLVGFVDNESSSADVNKKSIGEDDFTPNYTKSLLQSIITLHKSRENIIIQTKIKPSKKLK